MFKKSIIYVVLFSMALHCGCRLGFLDHLYQMRHQIAYTIGLIAEVPMAMCNSDYDFDRGIKMDAPDSEESVPISTLTQEINLFYIPAYQLVDRDRVALQEYRDSYIDTLYQDHPHSVFHPPAFS